MNVSRDNKPAEPKESHSTVTKDQRKKNAFQKKKKIALPQEESKTKGIQKFVFQITTCPTASTTKELMTGFHAELRW